MDWSALDLGQSLSVQVLHALDLARDGGLLPGANGDRHDVGPGERGVLIVGQVEPADLDPDVVRARSAIPAMCRYPSK